MLFWPGWHYTPINWVGGQCRDMLHAAFAVFADRREVSEEKVKGNIYYLLTGCKDRTVKY